MANLYNPDEVTPFTKGDAAAIRRLEVRLTKLMYHLGIDEFGEPVLPPRHKPSPAPLNKQRQGG